jgi:hypothetical protein
VEDLDAIHILVDKEYTKFIYNPIIYQKEHPEAPSWCVAFWFDLAEAGEEARWLTDMV